MDELTDPRLWSRAAVEEARDRMNHALETPRAGEPLLVLLWNARRRCQQIIELQSEIEIQTPEGVRRYYELRGERLGLESLLTEEMGLTMVYDDLELGEVIQ